MPLFIKRTRILFKKSIIYSFYLKFTVKQSLLDELSNLLPTTTREIVLSINIIGQLPQPDISTATYNNKTTYNNKQLGNYVFQLMANNCKLKFNYRYSHRPMQGSLPLRQLNFNKTKWALAYCLEHLRICFKSHRLDRQRLITDP